MIFNGIEKEYLTVVRGRKRPAWAPVNRHLISVTGMTGAHLSQTDTQVRVISVPVFLMAENIGDLQKVKEDLAEWLIHDEPKELVFKDEPDRTYYAVVDGSLDLDELVRWGEGVITFICPDPYKYGPEKVYQTDQDTFIIENEGTAETEPIITLTAKEPTTFAMVTNGEEYMMIGRPVDADSEEVEELTKITEHDFSSFTGWTTVPAGTVFDGPLGGLVDGTFAIGTGQWYVNNAGSNPNGWHGPARVTSLSETLQDFQVDFFVSQLNFVGDMGKVVLFLRDEAGNVVASMGARDQFRGRGYHNKVQFYLGNSERLIYDYQGFNNTQIWLRLIRKGTQFTAMAYQVDDNGRMFNKVTRHFEDRLGQYQTPIRQAVVYAAGFKEYAITRMYVNHLKVFRVNDLSDNQVPYIADAGDEIVFDHQTGDCYLNGEPVPFEFGADFFKLKKGENSLAVMPENTFETSVKYRERYK